ncbi:MAG: hypothetical protein WC449_04295 [Candidatus Paceibacterota bacterium]
MLSKTFRQRQRLSSVSFRPFELMTEGQYKTICCNQRRKNAGKDQKYLPKSQPKTRHYKAAYYC